MSFITGEKALDQEIFETLDALEDDVHFEVCSANLGRMRIRSILYSIRTIASLARWMSWM